MAEQNEALVLDNPKVPWSAGPKDERKVRLVFYTTPAELRMIAQMLEERSEVRTNQKTYVEHDCEESQ